MRLKPKITRQAHRKTKSTDSRRVKIRTENNRAGIWKTLFVGIMILLQLALMISLYTWLSMAFEWYMAISFAFSLVACILVLSSKKNGQSKAVWILFLAVCFTFGYVIYILSDERFFFRKGKVRYEKVFAKTKQWEEPYVCPVASPEVVGDSKYLYSVGNFSPYTNTSVAYFATGGQLFDDVFTRLQTAKRFVLIEFFIVADGKLLNRLVDLLASKVKEGVDVRMIYDDMGSHGTLSSERKEKIRKAGIKIRCFNRLIPWFSIALNYRDHRKIIDVDGETVYTGGCNLGDEYVNDKRMHGYWKDEGIRLDGKAVEAFTLLFLRQWAFITSEEEDYTGFFGHSLPQPNTSTVIPYADGLDYPLAVAKGVYESMIASAKKRIWLMTPYFIPDDTITDLLIDKARAGVDVRIILPAVADKTLVYVVSLDNAELLLGDGVKLYCMKHSFVHSKVLLTENAAAIGSINMDLRSFYQQFECAVYTDDATTLWEVEQDFKQTIPDCEEITPETGRHKELAFRTLARVLRILAPLM